MSRAKRVKTDAPGFKNVGAGMVRGLRISSMPRVQRGDRKSEEELLIARGEELVARALSTILNHRRTGSPRRLMDFQPSEERNVPLPGDRSKDADDGAI
jgi:hypothetical protein